MEGVEGPVVAIHQPNYAPWIGYFVKMAAADIFVLLDDVQFSKGSWTNRTKVLGPSGPAYLTVPLKDPAFKSIRDLETADDRWPEAHLRKLRSYYSGSPGLPIVDSLFEVVGSEERRSLVGANIGLIERVRSLLGIKNRMVRSSELAVSETDPVERLIGICRSLGGHTYLSGRGGASYNDPSRFAAAGTGLVYLGFDHPAYQQGREPFTPGLSILDLLASRGPAAAESFGAAVASCRSLEAPPTG
jgi:hypothetical protein